MKRFLLGAVAASMSLALTAHALPLTELNIPASPGVPASTLELPEAEVLKLIKEIESQGWVGSDKITLDALRHPGDKAAYDKAIDALSTRMQWAIYELSELKRNVIRYSVIVNQTNLEKKRVAYITDTSSKISQNHYFRAIWSIAGVQQDENEALSLCVSEVCVIEVADAFEAMTRFAQSVNRDLDFRKLNSDKIVFWRFDRPILRASFSKTFRAMIPNNQDHNGYKVLAAGILTPLSVVGVTTFDLLKAAGSAIFNPRYSNIKLTVDEVKMDFDKMLDAQDHIFKTNYKPAADGTRAKEYDARARAAVPAPTGSPQADPAAPQTRSYWFSVVKGSTTVEKEACTNLAMESGAKRDGLLRDLQSKGDNTAVQNDAVGRFVSGLTPEQSSAVAAYASSYKSFESGRKSDELAALDQKMMVSLYQKLEPNLNDLKSKFEKAADAHCEKGSHDDATLSGRRTASGLPECVCSSHHSWDAVVKSSLQQKVSLAIGKGAARLVVCSSFYVPGGFDSCSSADLATGARTGQTFEESLKDDAVVERPAWAALTREQFVRQDVASCF